MDRKLTEPASIPRCFISRSGEAKPRPETPRAMEVAFKSTAFSAGTISKMCRFPRRSRTNRFLLFIPGISGTSCAASSPASAMSSVSGVRMVGAAVFDLVVVKKLVNIHVILRKESAFRPYHACFFTSVRGARPVDKSVEAEEYTVGLVEPE